MNNITFLSTALTVAAMMTSCGNDDNEVRNNDRVAVQFTSISVDLAQTRVDGSAWAEGDPIGIYMVEKGTTDIAENAENIPYTANPPSGTVPIGFTVSPAAQQIYYPLTTPAAVDFYAYHPYQIPLTNWMYKVDVSDQDPQTNIDLLWAKADNGGKGYTTTTTSVNLPFAHQLAKLYMTVQRDASVPTLSGLTVAINGLNTKADFDLKTGGALTASGTPTVLVPFQAGSNQYEAILLPATTLTNQTVTFTVGSDVYTWKISDNISEFKRGEKYDMTVTLRKKALTVTGSITDWASEDRSGTAK